MQNDKKDLKDLKIMNMCEENSKVNIGKLVKALGWEFLRTHASVVKDGGNNLANQQKGFQLINPTDSWFPGNFYISEDLNDSDCALVDIVIYRKNVYGIHQKFIDSQIFAVLYSCFLRVYLRYLFAG